MIAIRLSSWLTVWSMMSDTLTSCASLLRKTAISMISLAISFDGFSDFKLMVLTCKMKRLWFWRREGLAPEKCFTKTLLCGNYFPNRWYASLCYPLMWWRASLSFYHFCSSVWCSSHVSLLYCSILLLLYLVLWLWSFVVLSLFIWLVVLLRDLLIFCWMLELSVSFIKITYSKVLWVFTPKLCFTFSCWWT